MSTLKRLTVIARSGGHEWVDPTENGHSTIPGVFCRICLLMRRADGKNKACPGPAKLVLRSKAIAPPQRIQLRRTKGWRLPANTKKVDRSTRWGNPYLPCSFRDREKVKARGLIPMPTRHDAVRFFRAYAEKRLKTEPDWLKPLRGQNLACWCKPGEPCHGDVLLELANRKDRL